MVTNLKVTHNADGTEIPLVESTSAWEDLRYEDKAYCYYDNTTNEAGLYGALYTWAAVMKDYGSSDYCSNFGIEELPLNETLDMRYSELYCNAEYEIRLRFDSLQDSRCPTGAMCIWEGNGRVQLILRQGDKDPTRFWLNTHVSFLTDTVVKGLRFELVEMLPYPEVDKDYQPKDYILHLRISD